MRFIGSIPIVNIEEIRVTGTITHQFQIRSLFSELSYACTL